MRGRFRNLTLLTLGFVVAISLWMLNRKDDSSGTLHSKQAIRSQKVEPTPPADPTDEERSIEHATARLDAHSVRGAGFIWGAALKNLYAGAKINADGSTRLNVTALNKSFKGYHAPIDLGDRSVSAHLRAEYMAAAVLGALDLDAGSQPALVPLLESYYDQDAVQPDPIKNNKHSSVTPSPVRREIDWRVLCRRTLGHN